MTLWALIFWIVFKRSENYNKPLCSQWDITIVLKYLRDHCEPMNQISLNLLTFKTVFLTSLASARKINGIHPLNGLLHDISLGQHKRFIAFIFVPEFRAKTKVPMKVQEIKMPAQKYILDEKFDIRLCQVRALPYYLDRTKARRGTRRLSLSINDKYKKDI